MRIINTATNSLGKEISFFSFKDEYINYSPPRSRFKFGNVLDKLNAFVTTDKNENLFLVYITNNFYDILGANPDKLEEYVNYVNVNFPNLLYNAKGQTNFGKLINEAYNYSGFRTSTKAKWFARALNIKTCLYCNSQSTLIIDKKRSGLLFQFDHFFSKAKYPFLSLSMCNLIPSCSNCNISKSSIDFTLTNSIHPYKEDMNELLNFYIEDKDVIEYLLKKDRKINILLDYKSNARVKKHIETFSLDKIYNEHSDYIEELFLKAYYYNKTKQKELAKEFKGIIDEKTIRRFILGNYYLDDELNKRTLAKMIKDISRHIKIFD